MTGYGTRTSSPDPRPLSDWQRDRMAPGLQRTSPPARLGRVLIAALMLGALMAVIIGYAS